ncbi:hypothetical protein HK098_001028 [Nowakowskiella sp. JEL0407]|nr:hypothetical protein HK098_001028 [Nowakowskiella sp. JEL0407]
MTDALEAKLHGSIGIVKSLISNWIPEEKDEVSSATAALRDSLSSVVVKKKTHSLYSGGKTPKGKPASSNKIVTKIRKNEETLDTPQPKSESEKTNGCKRELEESKVNLLSNSKISKKKQRMNMKDLYKKDKKK